jgi:DNA-binding CsgD family transcriptional regulator
MDRFRPRRPTSERKASQPTELRVSHLSVHGEELAVLSYWLPSIRLPEVLTPAERFVVREILAGRSNEEIAAQRGTSERTVANQLSAIYRKLGVGSRAELALAVCFPGGSEKG